MNDDPVDIFCFKDNPLRIIKYGTRTLVDGLFRLYDEKGFPLADSISECKKRGMIPCVHQFVGDAVRAGWSHERAQAYVAEAERDSAIA